MASKLRMFVMGYSVVLLALFFIFCFLMTTVDPPKQNQNSSSIPESPLTEDDFDEDRELGSISYGLARAVGNASDFVDRPDPKILLFYRSLKLTNSFVEDPLVVDVMPPTWDWVSSLDKDPATTTVKPLVTASAEVPLQAVLKTVANNISSIKQQ